MLTPLERLHEDRDHSHRLLERLSTAISRAPVSTFNEVIVNMKLSELNGQWERFQETSTDLLRVLDPDDAEALDAHDVENFVTADIYQRAHKLLADQLETLKQARARPTTLKPSEVVMPKFAGRYTEWVNWRSQFVSKVKDSRFTAAEKIDLLINALSGEALQCAGEAEHRDDVDFQRMWTKLEATYDNKYQIITEHINKLLDLPQMTHPVPELLRRIIDTAEQELRSLERFGYQTEAWDPLITVMILRKLDPVTIGFWEMDRNPTTPPSLKDVVPFVERRIMAIRNLKSMNGNSSAERASNAAPMESFRNQDRSRNPFKRPGSHDEQATRSKRDRPSSTIVRSQTEPRRPEPPKCRECKVPHFMWHCPAFKLWPLDKRIKMVAEWGLCPCCLVAKHAAADCAVPGCKRCDMAPHNNMLCPRHMVFRVNAVSSDRNGKGRRGLAKTQ